MNKLSSWFREIDGLLNPKIGTDNHHAGSLNLSAGADFFNNKV